jgi:hypothetical protein
MVHITGNKKSSQQLNPEFKLKYLEDKILDQMLVIQVLDNISTNYCIIVMV